MLTPRRKRENGGALNDDDDDADGPKSLGMKMRASSRRLGASAGLLKNALKNSTRVGQLPFQFRFEIFVESLEKLNAECLKVGASNKLVISAVRGEKAHHTKPFGVNATAKNAVVEDTISLDVTLFKAKEEDSSFCEKLFKFALRDAKVTAKVAAGGAKAQSLGKIMLDLADYAAAPSGSRRVAAALNNGVQMVARIDCTFISAGRSTRSVSGASSANGGSAPSEWADDSVCDDDEVFIDLDDIDDGEEAPKSGLFGRGLSFRNMSFRGKNKKQSKADQTVPVEDADTVEMRKALERLENENQKLEKQNDNLLSKIAANISAQSENGAGGMFFSKKNRKKEEEGLKQRIRENQALKAEIKQLSAILDAEKEVDEVVEELKESKLELAIAYLEKEQVHLNLMTLQRTKR
uniref:C2 NT-type domain-containing protein n=1 Tax=Erythrolobus australicus TaxID=1077150 RepID=A0A7S1XJY0_9RHOD